jgi:hypothetical protein
MTKKSLTIYTMTNPNAPWFRGDDVTTYSTYNTRHLQIHFFAYFGYIVESPQVLDGAGEVQAIEGLSQCAVAVALWGQRCQRPHAPMHSNTRPWRPKGPSSDSLKTLEVKISCFSRTLKRRKTKYFTPYYKVF